MNTKTTFDEIAALESELTDLAPLVRQGFDRAGGPSAHMEEAIRAEARRFLAERASMSRAMPFAWRHPRALAAVAAVALLLGGSLHLLMDRQPKDTAPAGSAWADDDNTASFANLLLDIQGLNEEGYFNSEGEESLWL